MARLPEPLFAIETAARAPLGKPTKSLVMMVKNEEKNLGDCLAGVRDLFDEVIVIDTGSTDRTKEIATAMGAKVFDFPWVDSFAAARNEGLRHATGDWIFWLDADDRLDEPNRAKLKTLLDSLGFEPAAFVIKCRCEEPPPQPNTVVTHVRLFRADPRLRWTHRVHEQILPSLRSIGTRLDYSCDVEVRHVGYRDPGARQSKDQRNLRLLEIERTELNDHPFTLFNLGQTYRDQGRIPEALACLQRSIERSDPSDSIVRKLYVLVSQCHRQLGRPEEAVKACQAGRAIYPNDVELLLAESNSRRMLGDAAGAESCLRQMLEGKEEGDHLSSVPEGLRGYLGRHFLADLLFAVGRDAEAEVQWRMALTEAPEYTPAWLGLGRLYIKTQKWAAAEQIADQLGESATGFIIRGELRLARKEFAAARWVLSQAIELFPQEMRTRVLLSHTLLQEGKDLDAAERALRDVLAMDPNQTEARSNLQVLLEQRKRDGGTPRLSI